MATDTQIFDSSGTWTRPADATGVSIVVRSGAGGGGGGGSGNLTGAGAGGGGGGASSSDTIILSESDIPASISVAIGAGGIGGFRGQPSHSTGGAGGDGVVTMAGNIINVPGGGHGNGGRRIDPNNEFVDGGNGGSPGGMTGGNGSFNIGSTGGAGGAGGSPGGGRGGDGGDQGDPAIDTATVSQAGSSGANGRVTITTTIQDIVSPSLPSAGPYSRVGPGNITVTLPAASDGTTPLSYSVSENDPDGTITNFIDQTRVVRVNIPSAPATLTITYTVTDDDGRSDSISINFRTTTSPPPLSAPQFSDDTGNDQSWTENTAITSITVPTASGNPTPTYAVVGSLPTGISFSTSSRVISGTPTEVGSGTITIRATNSQDSDDWTVAYAVVEDTSTPNPPSLPSTIGPYSRVGPGDISRLLPAASDGTLPLVYSVDESDPDGSISSFGVATRVIVVNIPSAPATLTVTYTVTDDDGRSDSVSVDFNATAAIPPPTTLTLPDPPNINRTEGGSVYSTPLPAASGGTTPYTYSVSGLPSFIGFNSSTRTFTGTEDSTGSWNLTYTVVDSGSPQQSASRSLTYTINAQSPSLVAPNFSDDTGNDQSWVQNVAITSINVPLASGNPTPSYSVVGSLPVGITFDTSSRIISGTPTEVGNGTITIRASNSEGDDDWTIDYVTTVAITAPLRPNRPTLTVISGTNVLATFSDPDNGGSPITSRNLRYREVNTIQWTTEINIIIPFTITGLIAGTEYEVQARVRNIIGVSPWSLSRTVTTQIGLRVGISGSYVPATLTIAKENEWKNARVWVAKNNSWQRVQ